MYIENNKNRSGTISVVVSKNKKHQPELDLFSVSILELQKKQEAISHFFLYFILIAYRLT